MLRAGPASWACLKQAQLIFPRSESIWGLFGFEGVEVVFRALF